MSPTAQQLTLPLSKGNLETLLERSSVHLPTKRENQQTITNRQLNLFYTIYKQVPITKQTIIKGY